MKSLIFSLVTLFAVQAHAGDNGGGRLVCASDSGRTRVEGGAGAPWNGMGAAQLVYTIDGASLNFDTATLLAANSHLVDYVVYSHKKSYAVGFKRSNAYGVNVSNADVFQMRSIAGTMTQVRADVFRFKAIVPAYTSVDPRKGGDLTKEWLEPFDQDIQVNCELNVTL